MRDVDGIMALAAGQNSLFTAEQARAHGLSRRWVAGRMGSRLTAVLPGIYWTRTGPPPRDVLLDAALLHGGPDAVLSHATAAEVWRLKSTGDPAVHITTPLTRHVADVPGVLATHRSADLTASVRRVRGGRAVTSLERTVIDLTTSMVSITHVRACTADAVQRGLTVPGRLVTELARRPSLPGIAQLAEVLLAVSEGARSVLEIELAHLLASSGLPAPQFNPPVVGASGREYRADALWPDVSVIVEADGREWHLSPEDWERDLERMADLTDAGFTLLRFTATAIRKRATNTVQIIERQLGRQSLRTG